MQRSAAPPDDVNLRLEQRPNHPGQTLIFPRGPAGQRQGSRWPEGVGLARSPPIADVPAHPVQTLRFWRGTLPMRSPGACGRGAKPDHSAGGCTNLRECPCHRAGDCGRRRRAVERACSPSAGLAPPPRVACNTPPSRSERRAPRVCLRRQQRAMHRNARQTAPGWSRPSCARAASRTSACSMP